MWQNLSAGDLCTRDTVFALPQTGWPRLRA